MAKIDLQYDLVNYTPASASPVEANFNRVEQHINQEVIERGGTVAMTAQLKLVGDPIQDLDAAPKQYVDQVIPVGLVSMFGGAGVPPGGRWAVCNGAELQTATYPALHAVIGYSYGGSGGRFNLPNLTDRFPVAKVPGSAGGNKDSTLPAHTHDATHNHPSHITNVENADHFHGVSIQSGGQSAAHYHKPGNPDAGAGGWDGFIVYDAGGGAYSGGAAGTTQGIEATTHWNEQDHSHGVNGNTGGRSGNHQHQYDVAWSTARTGTEGVAPTDTNMPPYLGFTFIIRVS